MKFQCLVAGLLIAHATVACAAPSPANADAGSPAPAEATVPGTSRQAPGAVASAMPGWMREARVPGVAVARIEDGKLAWTAVFGERAPDVPLTADTVFNVASLTKPVFALMALQLVAEGDLQLDATLAGHWVDPDIADDPRHRRLTPRILLSHQAGFPNWRGNRPLAFDFDPGTRHEYSGEGYEYLRRAIERKTGLAMPELMRRHVLSPAGMEDTWFGWNDRAQGRLAGGYRESGHPYTTDQFGHRAPNAAAAMLTTIHDYGRFAAWVAGGAGLPETLFADMTRPQAMHPAPAENFGLGWRLIRMGGNTVLSHDGRENGVRTQVFVVPATREGLVILTASDNGELLTRPLVEATMSDGSRLMDAISNDVWTYLQRMPAEQLPQIAGVVSRSPSFMSKLLHAVDVALVAPAMGENGLSADERAQARQAIAPFVSAMLRGEIGQPQAESLVARLVQKRDGTGGFRQAFTPAQAREWTALLGKREGGRATRDPVEVDPARLDRYAGHYLMPSSQLPITVTRSATGLQATAPGMPVVALHASSQTGFFMEEDDTRFEFVESEDGQVSGLRVIWSADRSEVAPRVD